MSSDVVYSLIVGLVGLAILAYFAIRTTRVSRAVQAAGRPRPRAIVVFWIACVVAVVGYVTLALSALLGAK